ncbi:MAG: AI-2E family transporter [Tissierellia bacterium]|nr:AI-2E family transporter [Tissierellia bacterium]
MDIKELLRQTFQGIKKYIKGLLTIMLINFLVLCIGLYLIGINYWGLKAFLISVFDIIPVLGSGMILLPWAIIKAATGMVQTGAYLAVLYVILVVIRFVGEPLIIGKSVGVSPLLTFTVTGISTIAFGPVGAIIGGFLVVPIKIIWSLLSGRSTTTINDDTTNNDTEV